jgi:hypothetical protein
LEVGVAPVDFRVLAPVAPDVLGALASATMVVDAIATTLMVASRGVATLLCSRAVVEGSAGTWSPLDVEVLGDDPPAGGNDDDEVLSSGAVDVDADVDVAGAGEDVEAADEVWSART